MCFRKLTSPLSKQRGFGPVCFGKRPSLAYKELESQGQLTFGGL